MWQLVAAPGSYEGNLYMSTNIRIRKICEHCKASFIAQQYRTKFCSLDCAQKNYKQRARDAKMAEAVDAVKQSATSQANTPQPYSPSAPYPDKDLLTLRELSMTASISERTLFRLLKVKDFPAIRIGKRLLFHKPTVLQYFNHKYGNLCEENSEKENLRKVE
jgi:hypothetical protein